MSDENKKKYITVHLPDGRKITKDRDKLIFFRNTMICYFVNDDGYFEEYGYDALPVIQDGYIAVNMSHVIDMRPAEEDEIRHAEIHGW